MIKIIEKPESVSWEDIRKVVFQAHSLNRKNGVDIKNAHLTGDEMRESIGDDGICLIAIDTANDGRIVATCSVAFHELNRWYAKGLYAYATLEAVIPEFAGKHIFSEITTARLKFIKHRKCKGIYMKVAEHNVLRRKIAIKEGYTKVSINRTYFNPHNYITYVMWLGRKPFPEWYIQLRYCYSWITLKFGLFTGIIKRYINR